MVIREFEYPGSETNIEGVLTELPQKLSGVVEYDSLSLQVLPASKRVTLWFRCKAKHTFEISLVRRGGRWLVVLSGLDPDRVMHGILICRDHFDRWFGITVKDILAYEQDWQEPGEPRPRAGA